MLAAVSCSIGMAAGAAENAATVPRADVVELGASPALEELSAAGHNVVARPGGGFAIAWTRLDLDDEGGATSGVGLLQLLGAAGRPLLDDPLPVVESHSGGVWSPAVVLGEDGGMFVAFTVQGPFVPGPGYSFQPVVQHVSSEGRPLWCEGGVTVPGSDAGLSVLVAGDQEDVFVCFSNDPPSESPDAFCARLDSEGELAWPRDLVRVATPAASRRLRTAVRDGVGGLIVAWFEEAGDQLEVRAQRLAGDGTRLWGAEGVRVGATDIGSGVPLGPRTVGLVAGGVGGALISFESAGDVGGSGRRVSVERLDEEGRMVWPDTAVLAGPDQEDVRLEAMVPDGTGGAYVVTTSGTEGSTTACRGDRVAADGELPWGTSGVVLDDSGCHSGRAAFARGLLALAAAARDEARVFVVRPDGSPVGPRDGHVVRLPPGARPSDAAWSQRAPWVLSVWESQPALNPRNLDVVGEVLHVAPPAPRRGRFRAR